jgi:hypothetical protein
VNSYGGYREMKQTIALILICDVAVLIGRVSLRAKKARVLRMTVWDKQEDLDTKQAFERIPEYSHIRVEVSPFLLRMFDKLSSPRQADALRTWPC